MTTTSKILIVDDAKENRILLKTILNKNGYNEIIMAESAESAFKYLGLDGNKSEPENVDLILMDIVMPGMNGIEACGKIKAVETLKDIPIVMVTAEKDSISLREALEKGAIDYVTKPINKVELLARIRSVLKLKMEMDKRKVLMKKLEAANRKLKELSSIDGLTGIANRRIFDEFLDAEWRRSLRYQKSLSLIMIDIDFFKFFNDSYGHQAGDDCLKMVAKALAEVFKRPGDLVARYGGEEFVVILPEADSLNAKKLAEKARTEIESLNIPHKNSKTSNHITVSQGTATTIPLNEFPMEDLIQAADKALYRSKHEGRNRVTTVDLMQ